MDKKINLRSIWGLQSGETWGEYKQDPWSIFALLLAESDSDLDVFGHTVERGQVRLSSDTVMDSYGYVTEHVNRPVTMLQDTDMSVAIFVSTTNFFEMLMYYLPWYDKINPTFKALCRALDVYFRYLEEQKERVDRNLDLDRAIELLPHWERRLGIAVNRNLSYEQRRRQIYAVKMLAHQQVTKETIAVVCNAFSNSDTGVDIYPHETAPHTFVIDFVSGGIPNNLDGLDRLLKQAMPADLSWEFTHEQTPWADIKSKRYRWGDVKDQTWAELNTYKEVESSA